MCAKRRSVRLTSVFQDFRILVFCGQFQLVLLLHVAVPSHDTHVSSVHRQQHHGASEGPIAEVSQTLASNHGEEPEGTRNRMLEQHQQQKHKKNYPSYLLLADLEGWNFAAPFIMCSLSYVVLKKIHVELFLLDFPPSYKHEDMIVYKPAYCNLSTSLMLDSHNILFTCCSGNCISYWSVPFLREIVFNTLRVSNS